MTVIMISFVVCRFRNWGTDGFSVRAMSAVSLRHPYVILLAIA